MVISKIEYGYDVGPVPACTGIRDKTSLAERVLSAEGGECTHQLTGGKGIEYSCAERSVIGVMRVTNRSGTAT